MSSRSLMESLLRPELLASKAYAVAPSSGLIKLDAMENPYGLTDLLHQAWLESLAEAPLNRYPDPHPESLINALKTHIGLPVGIELMLGNGSDELIQILVTAVAGTGRPIMAVDPSFVMYRLLAGQLGLPFVGVPLDAEFQMDLPAMLRAMSEHQPAIIFLDWPNNPSGSLFPEAALEAIIQAAPGLVVVDEAYHAFSQTTFAGRLGQYPNLLLLRTLSKEGLAGLRLGMLAGPAEWIRELDKLRLPYNINILTQRSAAFFLQHSTILDDQAEILRAERERLFKTMATLRLTVWPSAANFLLFHVPGKAAAIYDGLKKGGVLVKAFTGHPRLGDYLRVSVGKPAENSRFLSVLESLL
ncbi:histidinol-phosphate transaminase [Acidithiobacillus montserratensis]|uniref:Histidinol-phosphate transaminase n=1 Tax=Acidithiobacillus montserratensis TaxID=2729135 RepID=A0ACD5HHV6_9PROT|nr:histidinol-phosphate transaminase [Acidithiobacillus montserratensis]MBN2679088.1 histidinol-phosphate transaminase [Acidithiobacillaceae bacterium]MBU2747011.1 histidinol-phosphate transaminase [Acidithiobacillus montserratensis]